jgi:hypothetical protein
MKFDETEYLPTESNFNAVPVLKSVSSILIPADNQSILQ